ncbi:hypothetical protein C1645_881674 [Glomus cerebriforme]|uniref:Uncharacterized protein n=1 Tax=Glomus cerebriforme TaxID=658196 RepID=A0A397S944_9GLOM|nr:hypothetical protein C1645_881674 [Glomus cerebriforme]
MPNYFGSPSSDSNASIHEDSGIIQNRTILSSGVVLMKYILPENDQIIHCVSNEQSSMLPDTFLKEFQEVDNISLSRHKIIENKIETMSLRSVIILKTVHPQRYNNAIDLETISWSNVSAVCKNIFDYINNIIRSLDSSILTAKHQNLIPYWIDEGQEILSKVVNMN